MKTNYPSRVTSRDRNLDIDIWMLYQAYKGAVFQNTALKCSSKRPPHVTAANQGLGVLHPSFDELLLLGWLTENRTTWWRCKLPNKAQGSSSSVATGLAAEATERRELMETFWRRGWCNPQYTVFQGHVICLFISRNNVWYIHTFVAWQNKVRTTSTKSRSSVKDADEQ